MRVDREVWILARNVQRILHGGIAGGVLAFVVGCAPPPELTEGVCGNSAIDEGEECDRFAPEGQQCGEPGSFAYCRFVCAPPAATVEASCPDGSLCGIDGVCRAPAGRFRLEVPIGAGAAELEVGHLDGDEFGDVLTVKDYELRAVFGAALPADWPEVPTDWVELRRAFEPLFLPVAVERAEGSGADLVASRYGLLSLRVDGSGSDRQFAAAALPSLSVPPEIEDPRLFSAQCPIDMTSSDLLLFATVPELPEPVRHVLAFAPDFGISVVAPALGGASDLAGPITVEQVDVRDESPCSEVVLAYRDRDEVEVFTPFERYGPPGSAQWQRNRCDAPYLDCSEERRRLQVGAPVVRGAWVTDVDDDGLPDVIVQVRAEGCGGATPCYELRVSHGVADGSFHSSRPEEGTVGDDAFGVLTGTLDDDQLLLTIGDIDDNGVPDLVREHNVRLNLGGPIAIDNLGNPWVEALIVDLNADGAKDVVAVDASSSQALFFNGHGDGSLTAAFLPADAPLSQLQAGDFDGDRIEDLVAVATGVQRESALGTEQVNVVSVFFGRPAGAPEPPVSVGYSYRELSLSAGRIAADLLFNLSGARDGADDIFAAGRGEDGWGTVSGFVGRSDRELASALGLVEMVGQFPTTNIHPFVPRRVIAGRFGPGGGMEGNAPAWSLAVLAAGARKDELADDFRVWLTPSLGSEFAFQDLVVLADPIQREADPSTTAVWELGQFVAIDLDGDGVDELVAIAPLATDGDRSGYRIAHYGSMPPSEPPAWHWLPADDVGLLDVPSYRISGPTLPCRDPYQVDAPEPGPSACDNVHFSDLANTALDIPAVNGRLRRCPARGGAGSAAGDYRLFMLSRAAREHGAGEEPELPATLYEIVLDGSLSLSTASFQPVDGLENVVLYDFACLQADQDSDPELVVLGPEGLRLIGGPIPVPGGQKVPLARTGPYYRIGAADFDADGLDDVVLAGPGETVVLFAEDGLGELRGAP